MQVAGDMLTLQHAGWRSPYQTMAYNDVLDLIQVVVPKLCVAQPV